MLRLVSVGSCVLFCPKPSLPSVLSRQGSPTVVIEHDAEVEPSSYAGNPEVIGMREMVTECQR